MFDDVFDSQTRKDQLYLKWKQLMSHKYCHYCYKNGKKLRKVRDAKRNIYYCNRICQKKHFHQLKKKILHPPL